MPTGYTAAIADGITFKEYAMSCARAFGALVTMRDEPADAEIPQEFKPSTYNLERLQDARQELSILERMTMVEANLNAQADYTALELRRAKQLEEIKDLRCKYESMLTECKKYVAPTPDHAEFRAFMICQIEESIEFDCSTSFYDNPTVLLSGEEWLEQQIGQAKKDIVYHEYEYDKECQRVKERNAWVKALRESLK